MRTVWLLALCQCHALLAATQQKKWTFSKHGPTKSRNLTQFLKNPYIWTTDIETTSRESQATRLCQVDKVTHLNFTDVVIFKKYTHDAWPRFDKREELYFGIFLDPHQGPTSMLFMDSDKREEFTLEILAYASENYKCGVFYYINFNSSVLRQCIDKSLGLTVPNSLEDFKQRYAGEVFFLQCHKKMSGTSTRPDNIQDCDTKFTEICKDFEGHTRAFYDSCPDKPYR